MKKKLFILALLFVSVFTFFVNNFNSNSEELGVRDVYIEDNKYDLSYFENKYDIYNDDISSFEMNETYDSTSELISNNSLEDEYKIDCCAYINKIKKCFTFSYVLYINNKIELTSSVKVDIIEHDKKFYFSSSNGCISPCSELDDSNIGHCVSLAINYKYQDAIGIPALLFFTGGGGGGAFARGIAAITTVGVVSGIIINEANEKSSVDGNSDSSNESAQDTISDEEFCLNEAAAAALSGEANNYNWEKDSLKATLGLALNVVVNGELTKVKEIKKEKFTVYLGKYIYGSNESYENVAKTDEGSVVFSMDDIQWERLVSIHGEDGMWILNKFFLAYCISKKCDFVLTTAPDPYCLYGVPQTTSSYSKELSYIYSKGYVWNPGAPAYTRVSRA